ncbi:hypothetical protein PG997_005667 [Apiospora hydei]|uniref:Fungal N-terminal domain-containing protein n=1 Tax=Apiospora hydei TaxID=1337664 RepID=A0ABR1WPM4_9PEZI
MAEPLSLAASVAGLISLGLQVTGGIAKYLDAAKCRDEELSAVRQQNALLTDTLATIEKTTGKLSHLSPELAIDGIGLSITAATHETILEVQQWIPELQSGIGSVHNQLDSNFQVTMSQGLADTRTLSEKLDHAGETSQTSFDIQQEYLERIQGQGSDIVGRVAGIEQTLQTLLTTTRSVKYRPDDNVSLAITRLAAKPAVLRECCDVTSKLRNPCVCGRPRNMHRKHFQLGPWYLYSDLGTEGHLPYCPISRTGSPNAKRQYGFRYTGLTQVIKAAVGLSFVMIDGDQDRAFRITELVFNVDHTYGFGGGIISDFQQHSLAKIARLFARGKASPLAVNDCNQSLMHKSLRGYGNGFIRIRPVGESRTHCRSRRWSDADDIEFSIIQTIWQFNLS